MTVPLAFLVGCVTIPAFYVGGRLLGAAIVHVGRVRWL